MKTRIKNFGALLVVALLVTGCGDSNVLKKINPFSSDDAFVNPGGFGGSQAAQFVAQNVSCSGGNGQGRLTSSFRAVGTYHNGYPAQGLQPGGGGGGSSTGVAIGVSPIGDIIEVIGYSDGSATINLHMCPYSPLIIPGQRNVNAAMLTGSLVVKSRPGCRGGDEVTSAYLQVQVPTVNTNQGTLYQAQFPVTFSRYEDYMPGSCNN